MCFTISDRGTYEPRGPCGCSGDSGAFHKGDLGWADESAKLRDETLALASASFERSGGGRFRRVVAAALVRVAAPRGPAAASGGAAQKEAKVGRIQKWQTSVTEVALEWCGDSPYECSRCGAVWHRIVRLESRTPGGGALELAGSGHAVAKGANVMRVEKWQTAVTQVDLEWSDDSLYKCFSAGQSGIR